jgi:osmotically-inducible protein OsmY
MVRLLLVSAIAAAFPGCSANTTATRERQEERRPRGTSGEERLIARPAMTVVPENPADTGIRRNLNLAISHDPDLKDREISFIVANGDVSVSGTVRTEEERKKINDLAMNIAGVKSVANAVLIAE